MGISDETRKKWDDYIEFVVNNQDKLNDIELEILDDCLNRRDKGIDLTVRQSFWLGRMVERLEK
jgi:hypothetical protein